MGPFSGSMDDTVTVAEPTGEPDDYGVRTPGDRVDLKCDYEKSGSVGRDADGKIVEANDVFLTHGHTTDGDTFEVTEQTFVWPDGTDTTDDDQAVKPTVVRRAGVPGSSADAWEVTL